jgi:cysteine desulfurase family protein (TIGR01976 family)
MMQTTEPVLDTSGIRASFPALERLHNGLPVAYFDGPGGTQVPRQVVDAMAEYMFAHNANTHWEYPSSAETDRILADARTAAAEFVNGRPEEIAFGANMTTLAFHVSRALGRGFAAGDEIVVTELDHHANVAPWTELAKDRGLTIRVVRMISETGELDMDDLQRQVTPRCRLLAIGAASNALGTMSDVRAAADIAKAAGALVFVDAVHYAPHVLTDVEALGCDLLACSAYKFYGPHVGILWARSELIERLDVPKLLPSPNEGGERLETGTLNHEGIAGSAAAIDFLASLATGESRRERLRRAYDALHQRGSAQVRRLWDGLRAVDGVRVYGPSPDRPRSPTVSFTVAGSTAAEVTRKLADRGVFVSHGDFYAQTVVERLSLQPHGLVRAGCACYTSDAEVERLIEGVAALQR